MRAIAAAPARRRQPALVLAALHDLALAGRAPALAAAYAAGDGEAAAGAAIDTLLRHDRRGRRRRRAPAGAGRRDRALRRAVPGRRRGGAPGGADAVGLIDVGRAAGLNLTVDRVGIAYGDGQSLGDPASPVRLSASIVGDRPVPARAVPEVVARIVVDRDPVDVTDADDARWLRACLWPDRPERAAAARSGDRAGGDRSAAAAARATPSRRARRRRPGARGCPARRHHDVGAVAPPAREPPALPAPPRRGGGRPDGGVGVGGGGRASRRRYRRWATAAPPATASSAWPCSTSRRCAPRPSAAAGRGGGCSRGWPRSRFRRAASCGRPRARRRPPSRSSARHGRCRSAAPRPG